MGEFAIVSCEKAKQDPYPYVYVEENGSFRELASDEKEYLQEKFHPNDGGRPYVKSNYRSKTPDNKLSGFLIRSKLPKNIIAGQIPEFRKWWQFWQYLLTNTSTRR